MVPQKVRLETNVENGPGFTDAAHKAISGLNSVDGIQPRLVSTQIIEETPCPPEAA